jgi:tetratricopeptide (TPR) repeat protein
MAGASALDFQQTIASLGCMTALQKCQLALFLLGIGVGSGPVAAQQPAEPPLLPMPRVPDAAPDDRPPEAAEPVDDAARLDTLFLELAQPGRQDWERLEGEINRIWARSGSPSMDYLLRRGNEALEAEDFPLALERFSALTDHAPDFAEGWNARATTFYLMGDYALAISDVEHVLALNPRHFGALAGLGFMLESLGDDELALRALEAARKLNPNSPNISDAVERLERSQGAADL